VSGPGVEPQIAKRCVAWQGVTPTEQLTAVDLATLLRLTGTADGPPPADTTVASTAYQQILAVFAPANTGSAKDMGHALDIGATTNRTESPARKLKRLVTRGVLTEPEPRVFTLAQTNERSARPGQLWPSTIGITTVDAPPRFQAGGSREAVISVRWWPVTTSAGLRPADGSASNREL
jgi:hypothetical protein